MQIFHANLGEGGSDTGTIKAGRTVMIRETMQKVLERRSPTKLFALKKTAVVKIMDPLTSLRNPRARKGRGPNLMIKVDIMQ